MTVRIFMNVRRGPMDATAVCVFPWEQALIETIHGQDCEVVTIDKLANVTEGAVRVDRVKLKRSKDLGPSLREQLNAMAYVDPEDDPVHDPSREYARLVDKYGLDKNINAPVVQVVYGLPNSGNFERALAASAKETMPKPRHLQKLEEVDKDPADMDRGELRAALEGRGLRWKVTEGAEVLRERLVGAVTA